MSTSSKIILIGEHSVVYGKKAIAIPIKNLSLSVSLIDEYIFESEHVKYIKSLIEENFDVPKKYIKIESNIPKSAGMGSSASLAIEIARAYNVDENFVVLNAEKKKHGNPSGIDSTVILNEKAIIYQKNEKIEFLSKLNAFIVIANTREYGNTKKAIEIVKEKNRPDLIDDLGKITELAIVYYKNKSLVNLGKTFELAQNILKQLGVSSEKIEEIVELSKPYSLGTKLSGGGLGGVTISLCNGLDNARELRKVLRKNKIKDVFIVRI
ncbi:mevalonate kinase family protein [Oceanivirga miroungae]|uniref:mevalonate kinase n=1 Tax=Oceanivirga miroungae TaxID=1130046 RepID=A0A6I8MCJ5_9FUSO|nr:hypothetical protein [Oceanivirga miroungae]VWL84839.1 mevalonate kinase [Oceanivirga miroungae]